MGARTPVTNLKLQKLLFLCHAIFLVEKARPLVRGPFEAWQYGPVNREVYQSFREFGGQPITELAVKINPATGMVYSIDALSDPEARSTISKVAEFYGRWRVTELVELTHARDGPWDFTVREAKTNVNIGLKMQDSVIKERFKYHWFRSARHSLNLEETYEDRPLSA